MQAVQQFVEGLAAIEESAFTVPVVARYLAENPVDPASLSPFLCYEPTHYTRNLIYKSPLFELIAICWEVGQASRIHNHHNQNCWMAVPIGRLAVQNYTVSREDVATGFCELSPAERIVMDAGHPSHVDPHRPIHAVLNLPEYGARATSLHVYSRPYDRCLVYSLEKNTCTDVPLFYDTEYGQRAAS
jgi:cysteine dioxygenase